MKNIYRASVWVFILVGLFGFVRNTGFYAEPTVPSFPSAGSTVVDPTFGIVMLRLTDSGDADSGGDCHTGYSNLPAFNSTNTKVRALCTVGYARFKVWDWDSTTNTRSNARIQANPPAGFQDYGARWSNITYNKHYACANRAIYEITIPDGSSTTFTNTVVKDLSAAIGGSASDYCEQISISNDDDVFAMHYNVGGTIVGYLVYKRSTDTVLLNVTTDGTINEVEIDKSGRYLVVLTAGGTLYVWDLNGTPTKTTVTQDPFNHRAMGDGVVISSCLTRALCTRSLASPNTVTKILPNESWSYAVQQDHFSMVGTSDSWMLSCRYDINAGVGSNPYDNECLQVKTDGSGAVRRLVHHRSHTWSEDYDAQPKAALSIDGRYFAWTSNLDGADVSTRNDVFIADLYPQLRCQ